MKRTRDIFDNGTSRTSFRNRRRPVDESPFASLPVEINEMILQNLDAPSLAAARRTGRRLAAVGFDLIRTDDCVSKAMFTASLPRLVNEVVNKSQSVFQPYFTQMLAGEALYPHLIRLTPLSTPDSVFDTGSEGWIDPSGLVTFMRQSELGFPNVVTFQYPGQEHLQTGILQPEGNPGIDTYSAWLQQLVHCRILGRPHAHVVSSVFPFSDAPLQKGNEYNLDQQEDDDGWQPRKPRLTPCHVMQILGANESFVTKPFFDTLNQQVQATRQNLLDDDVIVPEPDSDALTDQDVLSILFQVVSLLADLNIIQNSLSYGIKFLSLNNVMDLSFVRDTISGAPLAKIHNFNEACIALTENAPEDSSDEELEEILTDPGRTVKVCQSWSANRTMVSDITTLLTNVDFILRRGGTFPRTRAILHQLGIHSLYEVREGQVRDTREISWNRLRRILRALELTQETSLPVA